MLSSGSVTALSGGGAVAISVDFPQELIDGPKNFVRRLPGTMRRIAIAGKSFWKAEAGRKLKSSRKKYQDAIDFQVVDNTSFFLSLKGAFVYGIEQGASPVDMKPKLMSGAKPWKRRKFPASIRHLLAQKSNITMYRIIPLNVKGYINMTKPTMFRTIHDQTTVALSGPNKGNTAWQHPGLTGAKLADVVVDELITNIIPKHFSALCKETL